MSNLLVWKEKLQQMYAKYSMYIDRVIRFVLALVSFILINNSIGFMQKLTNPVISIGLALVCAFLPMIITVFAAAGLMMAHMYSLSLGVAVIAAGILAVMFIFYFRVTPKKAIILLLTPVAFAFKVPMLIPVIYGLIGTPIYLVPVACGTVVYFLVHYAKTFATTLNGAEKESMSAVVTRFAKQLLQSKELWVVVAAMAICLLLVYALRRQSMNHAWEIAIVSGVVMYILVVAGGNVVLDVEADYVAAIIGSVVSILLGLALEIMVFSVDYARTEYLQFEDDEYYYYVKALPKVSVAVPEKKVKRINKRQVTEAIDTETVDKEIRKELRNTSRVGVTKKTQLTGDDDIDRLIERELMK